MKRAVLHFSFVIPAILFLTHQVFQKLLNIPLPLVDKYLDPFCFGALVPVFLLIERKSLFKQQKLSNLDLTILTLALIVFSEFILPAFFSKYSTDWFDVALIILGVLWFKLLHSSNK